MGLYQQIVCQIYSSESFDQTGDRMHRLIEAAGATAATSPELSYCTLEFPIFQCYGAYWLHDCMVEISDLTEGEEIPPRVPISREAIETLHKLVLIGRSDLAAASDAFPFTTTQLNDDGHWCEQEGVWTDEDLETLRSLEKPLFLFLQHAPRSWETYYLHDV